MQLGLVDITNEEYHNSDGYSKSALVTYRDSRIRFYKEYILKQRDKKDSDDLLLGEIAHAVLLEFDKVEERYHMYEHISRATKEGKLQAIELEEIALNGKKIVKSDIACQACDLALAVRQNNIAASLLENAEIEKSIFWQNDGITFKTRPDAIKGTIAIDFKTCKDIREHAFQRACVEHGYYLQAAMARLGMESIGRTMEKFVFICVDKITTDVMIYVLDEQAIEYGLNQFHYLSKRLEQDLAENDWTKPQVKTLSAPKWVEWYE